MTLHARWQLRPGPGHRVERAGAAGAVPAVRSVALRLRGIPLLRVAAGLHSACALRRHPALLHHVGLHAARSLHRVGRAAGGRRDQPGVAAHHSPVIARRLPGCRTRMRARRDTSAARRIERRDARRLVEIGRRGELSRLERPLCLRERDRAAPAASASAACAAAAAGLHTGRRAMRRRRAGLLWLSLLRRLAARRKAHSVARGGRRRRASHRYRCACACAHSSGTSRRHLHRRRMRHHRRLVVVVGDQRAVAQARRADLDVAWCMQFGPRLADAITVDAGRVLLVRALKEKRRAVEVDERMHVEDACRLDAPHPFLADADRLELMPHGKRDEGGLTDARLDLDDVRGRRVSHNDAGRSEDRPCHLPRCPRSSRPRRPTAADRRRARAAAASSEAAPPTGRCR